MIVKFIIRRLNVTDRMLSSVSYRRLLGRFERARREGIVGLVEVLLLLAAVAARIFIPAF